MVNDKGWLLFLPNWIPACTGMMEVANSSHVAHMRAQVCDRIPPPALVSPFAPALI